MESHQAFHVAEFEEDFFGVSVLFVFLEEGRAVDEDWFISLLVYNSADFNETVHVVFFLIEIDGFFVAFAGGQERTTEFPVSIDSSPFGLFFVDAIEEFFVVLTGAHTYVPEGFVEFLELAEEFDGF